MKELTWRTANVIFRSLEESYCRMLRLEPIGPLLYVKPQTYRGAAKDLGHWQVYPGDRIGAIHFNNRALQEARPLDRERHGAFVFTRLLVQAMRELAYRAGQDPELGRVVAFRGVTWIPPHGQRMGFRAEPLQDGWRARWLACYFRMLLFAFDPRAARMVGATLHPHEFWMSRQDLLTHFGDGRLPR